MAEKHSILITGATGLIGSTLVDLIKTDQYFSEIIILTRREIPGLDAYTAIRQIITDFKDPDSFTHLVKAKNVVCALGTTIKTAGTQENFRKVDYDLPMQIARAASANLCENFILVSSIGADPSSKVFYTRVKGELERDLSEIKFKSIHILHPSLLLGERKEKRTGERISKVFMTALRPLISYKYRAVDASVVASKIIQLSKKNLPGIHSYEGKTLYP